MTKQALVLGGGGTLGIAWETGFAAGLLEDGIRLSSADLFVGTSAGSVVGAVLASGLEPAAFLQLQLAEAASDLENGAVDPLAVQRIDARWRSAAVMTRDVRRELGAMALAAPTVPEADWVGWFARYLAPIPWPAAPLQVTAVNAETGDFVVWDRDAGVPLHLAVASSCTVPGLFPPVSIGGARYIDGGVRSGTNADLASGYDLVVVMAPLAFRQTAVGRLSLDAEIARLEADGSQVVAIEPDEAALAAFGPDMMDATRRQEAAAAGLRQSRVAAARLAGWRS